MKAVTVYFEGSRDFARLFKVFKRSWDFYSEIPLEVIRSDPPEKTRSNYAVNTNNTKLQLWHKAFTEDTIFLDCDLMFRTDISDGFKYVRDVGYTVRTNSEFPFNGGVVFARYTDYSKKFMEEWLRINNEMYNNPKFHEPYRRKYAGMNQAAFGYMLEQGWQADKVPEVYNMTHAKGQKQAKVMHIKSGIRRACLNNRNKRKGMRDVVLEWQAWEKKK